MSEAHVAAIARELSLRPQQVQAAARLLGEGATVPFIARYRKEATGTLDEVALARVRDRLEQLGELDARRTTILESLTERGLLTDELRARISAAATMTLLEDVYLPYRPKRRTRAMIAREKGLEPLAKRLFEQGNADPEAEARVFVDAQKGVTDVEEALQGARDIVAEWVSEDAPTRAAMRDLYWARGVVRSKVVRGKDVEGAKYRDYFDKSEPLRSAPSHRVLAILRGEEEGFLKVAIAPPEEEAYRLLEGRFVRGRGGSSEHVRMAAHESYDRLLGPSVESETRAAAKGRADDVAIGVFSENLRQLLMAPPLGAKRVLAVDPGFRTGCKVVCLDEQGKLLCEVVIYPHPPSARVEEASRAVATLLEKHRIEFVAVGNGTAGRETEAFLRDVVGKIPIVMVNESGASIYSASDVAREEFPDHDLTVRGAVSIGRRLADPLAELVKLDPKSIGVGQYQHDVDQGKLKRALDDVVMSCVNGVGVEVNTASRQLLAYVSGLGPQLAANIVKLRDEKGPFRSRRDLLEVPRLGPKAFEQAAGFLRIRGGTEPLDASAVHPESYGVVARMAKDAGCSVLDLMGREEARTRIQPERYVTDTVGLPTLQDILLELGKPGRDPREQFEAVTFAEGISRIEDLKPGLVLTGVVTNVAAFGAFVDVGVHQDGLVHVSQLADRFVRDAHQVVKVGQKVAVTVLEVDLARKRISLSMKQRKP